MWSEVDPRSPVLRPMWMRPPHLPAHRLDEIRLPGVVHAPHPLPGRGDALSLHLPEGPEDRGPVPPRDDPPLGEHHHVGLVEHVVGVERWLPVPAPLSGPELGGHGLHEAAYAGPLGEPEVASIVVVLRDIFFFSIHIADSSLGTTVSSLNL